MTTEPRLGPVEPGLQASIDRGRAHLKPHIDGLMEAAIEAYADHGDAAEPMLATALRDYSRYDADVLRCFVAHFAIEEAKRRAVSDVA